VVLQLIKTKYQLDLNFSPDGLMVITADDPGYNLSIKWDVMKSLSSRESVVGQRLAEYVGQHFNYDLFRYVTLLQDLIGAWPVNQINQLL